MHINCPEEILSKESLFERKQYENLPGILG